MLLTRAPLNTFRVTPKCAALDLHVLCTPPALILSQDQTLQKNASCSRQCQEPNTSTRPSNGHALQHGPRPFWISRLHSSSVKVHVLQAENPTTTSLRGTHAGKEEILRALHREVKPRAVPVRAGDQYCQWWRTPSPSGSHSPGGGCTLPRAGGPPLQGRLDTLGGSGVPIPWAWS